MPSFKDLICPPAAAVEAGLKAAAPAVSNAEKRRREAARKASRPTLTSIEQQTLARRYECVASFRDIAQVAMFTRITCKCGAEHLQPHRHLFAKRVNDAGEVWMVAQPLPSVDPTLPRLIEWRESTCEACPECFSGTDWNQLPLPGFEPKRQPLRRFDIPTAEPLEAGPLSLEDL